MDTVEINDLLKAHQVGDIHPKHPNWVWTQTKSGKYDWRISKKGTGGGGSSSEGGEEDNGAGGKKPATSASTPPKFQAMLDNPGKHADALAAHAQNASTSDLTDVVNNKKLNSQVRQIAFDALKERKDYDADKTDSSDLKGGKKSDGGGQNAELIRNLNIYHDRLMDSGWTKEEHEHNISAYRGEMEDALDGKKFTMKNVGAEPTLYYPDFKLDGIYNVRRGKGGMVLKFNEKGRAAEEWTHQDLCDLLSGKEVKMPDGDVYQLKTDDTGDEGTDTKGDKKSDTQAKPARNAKAVKKLDSLCADAMNRSASTLDRQKSLSRYGKALANTMLGKTIKVETTYGRKYDVTLRRMYKCKFGYGGIKTGFEDNKGETWDSWSHDDICNLLSGKEVEAPDGYKYKLKADTMDSENDILKAHQVGDRHPNGKYVWTEYQPGKFDWRIPGRSVERNKQLTERVQKVREALKDKQLHIAVAGGDDKSARSYPIAGIGQVGSNIMVRLKGVAQAVSIPVGKAEKMSFDGKRLKGVLPKYWTQGDLDCSSSASSEGGTSVWVSLQSGAVKKGGDDVPEEDDILKAQHQVGDRHPTQPWVWGPTKSGGYDWHIAPEAKKKKNAKSAEESDDESHKKSGDTETKKPSGGAGSKTPASPKIEDMSDAQLVVYARQSSTADLTNVVNNKNLDRRVRQIAFDALVKRSDYDKAKVDSSDLKGTKMPRPVPKVQYKQAPKTEIELPWSYTAKSDKTGIVKTINTVERFKKYHEFDDQRLLNVLNNTRADAFARQMAYETAAERGIDESKINVSGTLQDFWNSEEKKAAIRSHGNDDDDEDFEVSYDLHHITMEEISHIMKHFPNGDPGWDNKNDRRIKSLFHDFQSLQDEQKYDAFRDYQKRQSPYYRTPKECICNLNVDYLDFIDMDSYPLFVSAGGAGIGKSYGFVQLTKALNVPRFDSSTMQPSDEDWGWVACKNPKSVKALCKLLKTYGSGENGTYIENGPERREHGRILVFDDADKLLNTGSGDMISIMKAVADNDPELRVFPDPDDDTKTIKFVGKILLMTNNSTDELYADEHKKAILSRGGLSDIKFTVNETLEILADRYKTMSLDDANAPIDDSVREKAYQMILDNVDSINPKTFTVRKFMNVCKNLNKEVNASKKRAQGGIFSKILGAGGDEDRKITGMIQDILKKGEDMDKDSIQDASIVPPKKLNASTKKRMASIKKKNPRLYAQLFGNDALSCVDYTEGDDLNSGKAEERKKAEKSLFNDMSLDEAENLLFG